MKMTTEQRADFHAAGLYYEPRHDYCGNCNAVLPDGEPGDLPCAQCGKNPLEQWRIARHAGRLHKAMPLTKHILNGGYIFGASEAEKRTIRVECKIQRDIDKRRAGYDGKPLPPRYPIKPPPMPSLMVHYRLADQIEMHRRFLVMKVWQLCKRNDERCHGKPKSIGEGFYDLPEETYYTRALRAASMALEEFDKRLWFAGYYSEDNNGMAKFISEPDMMRQLDICHRTPIAARRPYRYNSGEWLMPKHRQMKRLYAAANAPKRRYKRKARGR